MRAAFTSCPETHVSRYFTTQSTKGIQTASIVMSVASWSGLIACFQVERASWLLHHSIYDCMNATGSSIPARNAFLAAIKQPFPLLTSRFL